MHVLLVEDNQDILRMLSAMLSHNMDVIPYVGNRQELLTPVPWQGVDAVLCDLMMPGVSGETILKYVATNHPEIRRVVFTGMGYVPKEIEDLAHVVIRKPADHNTILLALRSGEQSA